MRRTSFMPALVLALLIAFSSDAAAQRYQTQIGRVVDLACYVAQRATSPGVCEDQFGVKEGQPMGLLSDDGTLVLLVYPSRSVYTRLQDVVGQKVEVTGTAASRGGVRVFMVVRVKVDMTP